MDLATFETAIKARSLSVPFLIFAGREEFLKERAFDRMVAGFVAPEDVGDNVHRLDLGHTTPDQILGDLFSFSFNPSHRLFYLIQPEDLPAAQRKHLLERLATGGPLNHEFLIFATADSRAAGEIARHLGKRCEKIDFWPPFENQMGAWLQKEARESGAILPPDAADLLMDRVGTDLRLLAQELGKLAMQIGKGGTITPALVAGAVGYLRQDTVFDLLDCIGHRQVAQALRITESLLQKGEPVYRLWFMIVKTLRDFRLLHDLAVDRPDLLGPVMDRLAEIQRLQGKTDFRSNQERKQHTEEIQRDVGTWPEILVAALGLDRPQAIKSLSAALSFSRAHLTALWPRLLETDAALKSSHPSESLLLQRFLIESLGKKPPLPSRSEEEAVFGGV